MSNVVLADDWMGSSNPPLPAQLPEPKKKSSGGGSSSSSKPRMASEETMVERLIYPPEHRLGRIALVLGPLLWLVLIVGTFGIALIGIAVAGLLLLFARSALVAHLKGNGVELSAAQFPDLYDQFITCCDKLKIDVLPRAYVLGGGGALNAFAARFLGTQHVVLLSDVVDAMDKHADGLRFYLGHELGHLRMSNPLLDLLRWPALRLPLLGAAYARARKSTCDRHGLYCSSSRSGAARALAALAAGARRWAQLDIGAYRRQAMQSAGFWMSFHELTSGSPWLTKRIARMMTTRAPMPRRHWAAWVLATFVPYAGRLSSGIGLLVLINIVTVAASLALPAYREFQVKTRLGEAVTESQRARDMLSIYYRSTHRAPESLDAVGLVKRLRSGSTMTLTHDGMILTVHTELGELVFTPSVNEKGQLLWACSNGDGLTPDQLPSSCRGNDQRGSA